MVEFDLILEKMGPLVPRQWKQVILLCIPCLLIALHMGSLIYLGADIPKRCEVPVEENVSQVCNVTWNETVTMKAVPWNIKNDQPSTCFRFQFPEDSLDCDYWKNDAATSSSAIFRNSSLSVVPCTAWKYDDASLFSTSIVKEFDLVCSESYKKHLSQAIFMAGVMVGSIIWGYVSDRFGRKVAFDGASFFGTVFGIATAFSSTYPLFVVLRTLSGACFYSLFTTAFILMLEIVAPRYRVRIAQASEAAFGLGFCLLALCAYFVREWRKLQLVISIPMAGLLFYHWMILESPRWLIANNRFSEAYQIIKKLFHKKETSIEELKALQDIAEHTDADENNIKDAEVKTLQQDHSPGLLVLFRTPNIRSKTLKLFYCWLVCACVYYGLTLNAADIGGDPFINLFLSGFIEIPAEIIIIPALEKWGRRPTLTSSLILSGIACLAMLFVPKDLLSVSIVLYMVGKFGITSAFGTIYVYTAELYPTPIRNVGVGVCSSMSRVGGIISPFIAMLGEIATPLPYVIFGVMSIAGGFTALFLPEVLGKCLPETIEEGERFGLDQAGALDFVFKKCCCISKTENSSRRNNTDYSAVAHTSSNA